MKKKSKAASIAKAIRDQKDTIERLLAEKQNETSTIQHLTTQKRDLEITRHELLEKLDDAKSCIAFQERVIQRQRELLISLGNIRRWSFELAKEARLYNQNLPFLHKFPFRRVCARAESMERLISDHESLVAGIKMDASVAYQRQEALTAIQENK